MNQGFVVVPPPSAMLPSVVAVSLGLAVLHFYTARCGMRSRVAQLLQLSTVASDYSEAQCPEDTMLAGLDAHLQQNHPKLEGVWHQHQEIS